MAKKQSAKDQQKDLDNLRKSAEDLAKSNREATNDILNAQLDLNKAKEIALDLTYKATEAALEGKFATSAQIKIQRSQVKQLEQQVKHIQKTKKTAIEINSELQGAVSKIQDFVKNLPGGKMLSKAFGIDDLGKGVTKALNQAAGTFVKTQGSITATVSSFSSGLLAALGPITLIALAVTGLVKTFLDFEKKAKGVAEATGLTLQQSKALVNESKKAAAATDIRLATTSDILEVQKASIKEFGVANMLSAEQAANIADIGKSFGIGAKAAADVTNEFMRMGMGGTEAANALQDVSADALKAGVSIGAVTTDLATNASEVAEFFAGNVKALRDAAVQAAKLGVNLKTMSSVANNLLKFEDSISSQFEFQALTGKQINFDAARELALRGDIAGATKSVLDQVGSIADFENMTVVAQRKLAEATGMSVAELEKSLTIRSKLGDLDADQQAAMANMGLSAAEIKSMSSEELKNKLAQQQATDKLAQSFSVVKDQLTKSLIPAGEALVELFSMVAPIIKVIAVALKFAFKPITLAAQGMKMLIDFAREFQNITAAILTVTTLIVAKKKEEGIITAANNVREFIANGATQAKLFLQQSFNKEKLREGLLTVKNMAKSAMEGAMVLGKAIATLFGSFGQIPLGLGIPLAIAAAGGLFALFKKATSVGDLSIDPNGGPIVASPREGALFQGTRNDGVSMSPSSGGGGGGGGNVVAAIAKTNTLLQQLIEQGTTIEMDGQAVGAVLRTTDSFRRR